MVPELEFNLKVRVIAKQSLVMAGEISVKN
jgi:hypothetical protein